MFGISCISTGQVQRITLLPKPFMDYNNTYISSYD